MDEYYALIILNLLKKLVSIEQRADEAGEDLEKILEALKKVTGAY